MRSVLLGLIFLCEIIIYLTRNVNINNDSLQFMTTLVLVVLAAFTISAILRNFKSIRMPRNYLISGIFGVIIGVVYFNWVGQHLDALTEWLKFYGLLVLLLIILVSAVILYLTNSSSDKKTNQPSSAPAPATDTDSTQSSEAEKAE